MQDIDTEDVGELSPINQDKVTIWLGNEVVPEKMQGTGVERSREFITLIASSIALCTIGCSSSLICGLLPEINLALLFSCLVIDSSNVNSQSCLNR